MRIVQALVSVLVTALAILMAVAVALFAAVTGLAVYVVRRLRGPQPAPSVPRPARARRTSYDEGEIIDISATEVPTGPSASK